MQRTVFALIVATCFGLAVGTKSTGVDAAPASVKPFDPLLGWWIGQGRLGFNNGKTEAVKCRATYKLLDGDSVLRQLVRCASASGKVEVESKIRGDGDLLSGTWLERTHKISGHLDGKILPHGFRVFVKGEEIQANMTVLVRGARHVVEIQFLNSALVGLTLIFNRG